jgi:hypothetical protein
LVEVEVDLDYPLSLFHPILAVALPLSFLILNVLDYCSFAWLLQLQLQLQLWQYLLSLVEGLAASFWSLSSVVVVLVIVIVAMALSWTIVVLFSDEMTKERPSLECMPRQIKSVLPLPTVRSTKPMSMPMCNRRNNPRRRRKHVVVGVDGVYVTTGSCSAMRPSPMPATPTPTTNDRIGSHS